MRTLADYGRNVYSQFGEDGMIDQVLKLIGAPEPGTCVEVGANDGQNCSNTAVLRDRGWSALLIEKDPELVRHMERHRREHDVAVFATATPETFPDLMVAHGFPDPDLVSIDVDGADYHLFEAMQARPPVVVIEFNCSVPPDVDVRQATPDGAFGASALSLVRLGGGKGYRAVGASLTNLVFVLADVWDRADYVFSDDYLDFMAGREFTTVCSDYQGRLVLIKPRRSFYWGVQREWSTVEVIVNG